VTCCSECGIETNALTVDDWCSRCEAQLVVTVRVGLDLLADYLGKVAAFQEWERLTIDIDCRIAGLWAEADRVETWDIETVAAFMRAAYGMGYTQALGEDVRGRLFREHGYRLPTRGGAQ